MSFSKPNPMYLTCRSSSQKFNFKQTNSSMEKLIPSQRREKLKNLLIVKFMKKYGLQSEEALIEEEVTKFLKGEKLTDTDLQNFDKKIKNLVDKNKTQTNLINNLTKSCNNLELPAETKLPEINDNMSVRSHKSKVSHISENKVKYNRDEDDDNYSVTSMDSRANRTKPAFVIGGDNWDLIAKYNQKKFEEEKIVNKIKDKEIKRRIKDDLDMQMREKLLRNNEELKRAREFDEVLLKHVENMNALEREREREVKNKVLKEKWSRDSQLKDEIKRKKVEIVKNKKFEKEIGNLLVINLY